MLVRWRIYYHYKEGHVTLYHRPRLSDEVICKSVLHIDTCQPTSLLLALRLVEVIIWRRGLNKSDLSAEPLFSYPINTCILL